MELKQSSVVQRFLTGWMPTAIRLVFGDKHRELTLFYDSLMQEEVFLVKVQCGQISICRCGLKS